MDQIKNIPLELQKLPNWVVWRAERTDTGKITKIPYCPSTGRKASSTNPHDWVTFQRACETVLQWDGLGFMFGGSPFAGIDLDRSDDPVLTAWQDEVVKTLNSYTEYSPNGGRHIYVLGSVLAGRKDASRKIEIYSEARYFTVTGNVALAVPIRDCNGNLTALWESISSRAPQPAFQLESQPALMSDENVWRSAATAVNGDKFKRLWQGDKSDHADDWSAADQALMNFLCYYSPDNEQVTRMFKASALGARKKAFRPDYIPRTIARARDRTLPTIDLEGMKKARDELEKVGRAASLPANTPSPSRTNRPNKAEYSLTCPPGLLGEIAAFIYEQAPYQVPEVALAGAIALLAGICGRAYNISGTGLNQYVVLLAETGRGKEAAATGIGKLIAAVCERIQGAAQFIGPEYYASEPALMKAFNAPIPSFLSIIGECGKLIKQLTSDRASAAQEGLLKRLLSIYSSSGKNNHISGMAYSDKMKNQASVKSPALSLFGETTPDQFYELVTPSTVRIGLIPRFLLIEYLGKRPVFNNAHGGALPSKSLIDGLCDLVAICLKYNRDNDVLDIAMDEQATAAHLKFSALMDDKINNSEDDALTQIYNRTALKTLKLAGLLTVGLNRMNPIVSRETYEWARHLVTVSSGLVERRINSGQVGEETNPVHQNNELDRILDQYLDLSVDIGDSFGADDLMRSTGYITTTYIQRRLYCLSAFRKDRNCRLAVQQSIKECIEAGRLEQVRLPTSNAVLFKVT